MQRDRHNVMHKNIDFLVDRREWDESKVAPSNLSTFKKVNVVRMRGFLKCIDK